ncbi:uncharacterized protein LOC129585831 isoform X2 [Paramacrobiotus metropolitanus]|nr:uncharacterized protein LOC129585831 isoform X2 [Paramacrobiotus metropolitanus]
MLSHWSRYLILLEEIRQEIYEALETQDFSEDNSLREQLDVFTNLVYIWRLFQIVFFERINDDPAEFSTKYIIRLLAFRDSLGPPLTKMPNTSPQNRNPVIWDSIIRYVLLGNFSEAVASVDNLDAEQRDDLAVQTMVQVLERCPVFSSNATAESVTEWRSGVEQLMQEETVISNTAVARVFRVLLGDFDEWVALGYQFSSWISLYISRFLHIGMFGASSTMAQNLQLLSDAFAMCPKRSFPQLVDDIFESILRMNWDKVFDLIRILFRNTWFTVHTFDLLFCYGMSSLLDRATEGDCAEIREAIIVEYVTWNVSGNNWLPAVRYLKYCRLKGESVVAELISQVPFETMESRRAVENAFAIDGLQSALAELNRQDAFEALKKRDFRGALESAAQADDNFLVQVSNLYLDCLSRSRGSLQIVDGDKTILALLPEVVLLRLGIPGFHVLYERSLKQEGYDKALYYLILLLKRTCDRDEVYYLIGRMNVVVESIRTRDDDIHPEYYSQLRQFLMQLPLTNLKPSSESEKDAVLQLEKEVFAPGAWSVDRYSAFAKAHSYPVEEQGSR